MDHDVIIGHAGNLLEDGQVIPFVKTGLKDIALKPKLLLSLCNSLVNRVKRELIIQGTVDKEEHL